MTRCDWAYSPFYGDAATPGDDAQLCEFDARMLARPAGRVFCTPCGEPEAIPPLPHPARRITRREADHAVGRRATDEMRAAAIHHGATVDDRGRRGRTETDAAAKERKTLKRARRILEKRMRQGLTSRPLLSANGAARDYLRIRLAGKRREHMGAMWLDARRRLIRIDVPFKGTVDRAPVYTREFARAGLLVDACACIIFHNHPSGAPTPSQADVTITEAIKLALHTINIDLLDHVVVGGAETFSMAEAGIL